MTGIRVEESSREYARGYSLAVSYSSSGKLVGPPLVHVHQVRAILFFNLERGIRLRTLPVFMPHVR